MSRQTTLFDFTKPQISIDKPIRLVELFAGYGSQSMALERMGVPFECHKVVEVDEFAIKSFNACRGTDFPATDITKVHGKDLEITDTETYNYIMFYSFPCTDISQAGQMRGFEEGSATRSSLLWECKRILLELEKKPQILIMENVPAIHSQDNMQHLHKWTDFLNSLGYSSYGEDLNACDFGVAQSRERFFLVSILGDYNYQFPVGMDLRYCIEDYFQELTEEEALKYIVKSEKAMDLLVDLDCKGELE